MTAAAAGLILAGTACQVVGLLVLQRRLRIPWRRWLRRPPDPTLIYPEPITMEAVLGGHLTITGRTVEQEISALWGEVHALRDAADQQARDTAEAVHQVQRQVVALEHRVPAIIEREQRAQTEGVRWVASGVVLVAVGSLLALV